MFFIQASDNLFIYINPGINFNICCKNLQTDH